MKKIKQFVLAAALLGGAMPSMAQHSTKLGHIDRQKLMLMLPERADAEKKMQEFADLLKKRLDAMGQEYQAKLAEAQKKEASGTMTNTEKEMAIRDLGEMEQRIQDAQEKAQEDLAKQEEELLKPMVERTNAAIKKVADSNGFTYVFDTSTGFVLYFDKGIDILPMVKTELGIQ